MARDSQHKQAALSEEDRDWIDRFHLNQAAERNHFEAEYLERFSQSRWPESADLLVRYCKDKFKLHLDQYHVLAFHGDLLDVDKHYGVPMEQSRQNILASFDIASRNIPADRRKEVRSGLALELAAELQRRLASIKNTRMSETRPYASGDGGVLETNLIGAAASLEPIPADSVRQQEVLQAEHAVKEAEHGAPNGAVPVGRKRGRPQKISDALKAAALSLKDSGGTNRDAAVRIYETSYPTPQQVKNVSSILREYRKKSKRPAPSSQNAPKPRKIKG